MKRIRPSTLALALVMAASTLITVAQVAAGEPGVPANLTLAEVSQPNGAIQAIGSVLMPK